MSGESNVFALDHYDYALPTEYIAQHPVASADTSKLLVSLPDGSIRHRHFFDLPEELQAGDVLVRNDSQVIPARLIVKRGDGERELLLIHPENGHIPAQGPWPNRWIALVRGKTNTNEILYIGEHKIKMIAEQTDGSRIIEFLDITDTAPIISKYGAPPLPPYITTDPQSLAKRYQTTFAIKPGSVAAPTAGLHFTPELDEKLRQKGVTIETITLHVGLGTFKPVQTSDIRQHIMHPEWAEISEKTAWNINTARNSGRRIIAIGTTAARTLEGFSHTGEITHGQRELNIFIYPGYQWHVVDGLITNFHVPKSSLLMLVESLVGKKRRIKIYEEALKNNYRFLSLGDGSLLWK